MPLSLHSVAVAVQSIWGSLEDPPPLKASIGPELAVIALSQHTNMTSLLLELY